MLCASVELHEPLCRFLSSPSVLVSKAQHEKRPSITPAVLADAAAQQSTEAKEREDGFRVEKGMRWSRGEGWRKRLG